MQLAESDSILRCVEAFDFENRLWVILEIMEGAFTPMLEDMPGLYSEDFCKYSLYKTLLGLDELHKRNMIHRDIKSDNILLSADG